MRPGPFFVSAPRRRVRALALPGRARHIARTRGGPDEGERDDDRDGRGDGAAAGAADRRAAGGGVTGTASLARGVFLLATRRLGALLSTRVPPVDLAGRLARLPATAPVAGRLSIRFSPRQVPFVEAEGGRDLAVGLGIVHAHLRLSQIDLMRRAARGELAAAAGPAALAVDRLLRLIDFRRAAAASLPLMPAETRAFVGGFADGINAVVDEGHVPPDLALLGVTPARWSEEDVVAVSRLASADYTWKVWRTIRHLADEPDWPETWRLLAGRAGAAGEDVPAPREAAGAAATIAAPHGSNAVAVAPERAARGAAMLACDPHLPVMTPGIWFAVGLACPAFRAVGLTIPGLPILGVGRNEAIAWGGTNLHAASSELVDVTGERLETREVEVPVRWSRPARLSLRESRFGPVVSDSPAFRFGRGRDVALRWLGHAPSDEFSPFLSLLSARTFDDFKAAMDGYALPGLTMLYAGRDGRIAQKVAARLPRRPHALPPDVVLTPEAADEAWSDFVSGDGLPEIVDPPGGFLASANDEPAGSAVPVGFFFSAPDRVERLKRLGDGGSALDAGDLKRFQADTFQAASLHLRDRILAALSPREAATPVARAMAAWDGRYAAGSAGALAFEVVVAGLVPRLERNGRRASRTWQPLARIEAAVEAVTPDAFARAAAGAVRRARRPFRRFGTWGALHRVRLLHPLGLVPWLRRAVRPVDMPAAGSNETVMKSQHPFTRRRHAVRFGQNARFVTDLSDIDATAFCLLGGEDGWPGSDTLTDQAGPWERGEYLSLPLSPGGVAETFREERTVRPREPGA